MADVGAQHGGAQAASLSEATLYVIPGSHACAAAKLMLAHKGPSRR